MDHPGLVLKTLQRTAPELGLFPCRAREDQAAFGKFCEKYLAALAATSSSSAAAAGKLMRRLNFGLSQGKRFVVRRAVQFIFDGKCQSAEQDVVCDVCTAVLLHFYNFHRQRPHFERLHKLKMSQRSLPIFNYRDLIVQSVEKHQVVIIAGDTGCGKSTQTPQYLLEARAGSGTPSKKMACTQPRRIAAISLAKRVALECLSRHAQLVGYQIRFERAVSKATRLVFLTEGLLLRQFQSDAELAQYDLVILDEVHERHIFTDFLLGILLCLCRFRPDLKLVLMSATINVDLFSRYFDSAPVISVPGRLYPIELHYVAPAATATVSRQQSIASSTSRHGNGDDDDGGGLLHQSRRSGSGGFDTRPYVRILEEIDSKYPCSERGDVLIFVSGMSVIGALCRAIQEYADKTGRWTVLPLHSCLSADEQDQVFEPPVEGVRKCIISTNIAETSVTIDGVRFVIDSGKMKEMLYDSKYKLQRLTEFWISQASAEQRKGRAGRTGPGVCYRMYAESDYAALASYPLAEIQRVSLDSLVLQMVVCNLRFVKKFPFIEPPPEGALDASVVYLRQAGAVTTDTAAGATTPTPLGELLAQLPVDIVVGRVLILGTLFGLADPVLTVAAGLSVQSVFASSRQMIMGFANQKQQQSSNAAEEDDDRLLSADGDLITLLQVYEAWRDVKQQNGGYGSGNKAASSSRRWCRRRGIEEQRLYDISKLRSQFYGILVEHNLIEEAATSSGHDSAAGLSQEQRRELGRLRKRTLHQDGSDGAAKRKKQQQRRLRMDGEEADDDDDDDGTLDETVLHAKIQELEYRLSQDLLAGGAGRGRQGATMEIIRRRMVELKLVLAAGLYPQVAIADEANGVGSASSSAGDLSFHTRNKNFLLIHPSSIFYRKPAFLAAPRAQTVVKAPSRQLMSAAHQLLAFTTLLETNKPYLVNCMQVPAVQVLLLCAAAIDSTRDCDRLIFDAWLEVTFAKAADGEALVRMAIHLRAAWDKLLQAKLSQFKKKMQQQQQQPEEEDQDESESERGGGGEDGGHEDEDEVIFRLERELPGYLSEFLRLKPVYAFRRVFPAELSHLYVGSGKSSDDNEDKEANQEEASSYDVLGQSLEAAAAAAASRSGKRGSTAIMAPHPTKGGQMVTSYLAYNCLKAEGGGGDDESWTKALTRVWTCPRCGETMVLSAGERLSHEAACATRAPSSIAGGGDEKATALADNKTSRAHDKQDDLDGSDKKEFFCENCDKKLMLTPAQFLRHKLSHRSESE